MSIYCRLSAVGLSIEARGKKLLFLASFDDRKVGRDVGELGILIQRFEVRETR